MAKMIDEWASTSAEYPTTPGPATVSSYMRQLADNMYEKVAAYMQGQIEGTFFL